MTEPIDEKAVYDLLAEVNARLDEAIAKNVQRKEARKAERAEMKRRRDHGKAIGNAQRLRRARGGQEEEN